MRLFEKNRVSVGGSMKVKSAAIILVLVLVAACVTAGPKRKGPKLIIGQSGVMIPEYGVTFSAEYSPSLDVLAPGYKVITVALTNNSINQIRLDPSKDKWTVKTYAGQKLPAIHHLAKKDPQAWNRLSEHARKMMEYPLSVPTGYTQTFDLFVKTHRDLNNFQSMTYHNEGSGLNFQILKAE